MLYNKTLELNQGDINTLILALNRFVDYSYKKFEFPKNKSKYHYNYKLTKEVKKIIRKLCKLRKED